MKVYVLNDRLIVDKPYRDSESVFEEVLNIDAKELAKLLKPYIDSIDNSEV